MQTLVEYLGFPRVKTLAYSPCDLLFRRNDELVETNKDQSKRPGN